MNNECDIRHDPRNWDFAQILAQMDEDGQVTIRTYGNPDILESLRERMKTMLDPK